jgi:hypothetical protein
VNALSTETKIDRKTVKAILSNLGSLVSLTGNGWTVKVTPEEGTVSLWTDKAGQARPQYTKLYSLQGLTQNQSIIFSVIKSIGKYRKVSNSYLAKVTGLSRNTIISAVKKLRQGKLIVYYWTVSDNWEQHLHQNVPPVAVPLPPAVNEQRPEPTAEPSIPPTPPKSAEIPQESVKYKKDDDFDYYREVLFEVLERQEYIEAIVDRCKRWWNTNYPVFPYQLEEVIGKSVKQHKLNLAAGRCYSGNLPKYIYNGLMDWLDKLELRA